MAEPRDQLSQDGEAPTWEGIQQAMNEAGLAKDRTFAELLRLVPWRGNSTTMTAILPYGVQVPSGSLASAAQTPTDMVCAGPASTPIYVLPFTAIVGTRAGATATPSPDPVDTAPDRLNWRDIRMQVFTAPLAANQLAYAIPSSAFAANTSGNPRWDLIYVALPVESASTISNLAKPPAGGAAAPATSYSPIVTDFTGTAIEVVTGTPAATFPTIPSPPANPTGGSGTYCIPLAAVLVAPGFTPGTSTFSNANILLVAPIIQLAPAMGVVQSGPLEANTGFALAGFYPNAWNGGSRPVTHIPETLVGGIDRWFKLDATLSEGASPPVYDTSVVDQRIDWRDRYFLVHAQFGNSTSNGFADTPGGKSYYLPAANGVANPQFGQSFKDDSSTVMGVSRNAGTVFIGNAANVPLFFSGSNAVGLYVDLTTGNLRVFYQGTPGVVCVFHIHASGRYENP